MRRGLATMVAAAALVSAACAQTPAPSAQASAGAPTVEPSSARPIVVDVVVRDGRGHLVRGLKAENFRLTDGGVVQTVGRVQEHSAQSGAALAASLPAQPPGTFTDYTPFEANSTFNILLIDALNTPVKDEAFLRNALQQYVKEANPQTRIAVFGLANRLILLQGFTSDPAVLRGVVERKLIARSSSSLLSEDGGSTAAPTSNGSPSAIEVAANLREFQAELGEMETQLRPQYTLDAFDTLAHYLADYPGRKNLIWFAGSFPLTLLPDPALAGASKVSSLDQAEFRETVNLLSKAQVAVYPVDARSVMTQPGGGLAEESGAQANQARRLSSELSKLTQPEAAEHAMMDELAVSTGGRAITNASSVADAVSRAIADGEDYYTLSYLPKVAASSEVGGSSASAKNTDGYRPIRVELAGVEEVGGDTAQLRYRHGYYPEDASQAPKPNDQADASGQSATEGRAAAYRQAAMSRGGPTPADLIFKVRVLPASATTETAAAPDNQVSLSVPTNGPFRRYDIDYLSLPAELTFTPEGDGHRIAKVEFLTYVYDTEGRVLNEVGKNVSMQATTTNLAQLMHSVIRCHLEVSVPDRAETFLRIGVRDVMSNRFGVIEVPASSLSSLPVATYGASPAGGRAAPAKE